MCLCRSLSLYLCVEHCVHFIRNKNKSAMEKQSIAYSNLKIYSPCTAHSNECAMHTLNVINHIFTCLLKRFIVQRQQRRRWPLLRCWRTTVYIAITQSYCFKCVLECPCASMPHWIFGFNLSIFSSHTQQQAIAISLLFWRTRQPLRLIQMKL